MLDIIKNNTIFLGKYRTNSEAVIISCFFNPQGSEYRNKAFKAFYESIKHLPHRIIECVIGDSEPVLPENENIKRVYTKSMLWHKEALLNNIIDNLPSKYKYIFWVDADVLFTNKNWLVDGVNQLKTKKIIQPFEYCVHLEKDETEPSFNLDYVLDSNELTPNDINKRVWRSFCANYADSSLWKSEVYNDHGHVGFAWGARRSVLEQMPLYDKALVGGADHIIAHAAAGQIAHNCIIKSFTDDIDSINEWSKKFYDVVQGEIGYAEGNLYHIWHGDIEKREYLKRVKEFTGKSKSIVEKDEHGLYVANNDEDVYVKDYFRNREVTKDDGFLTSVAIGYLTDDALTGAVLGGNVAGAMLGDALNNSDEQAVEFGGGEFGGAGAGGTWEPSNQSDTSHNVSSDDHNLSPFS
jgi:hypothetical protein